MKNKLLALFLGATLMSSGFVFGGCAPKGAQVYAPDGAPALALAKLLREDTAIDGIEYTVTSANKITTFVDGKNPQADVCILPINQASTLLGDGSVYQMVGLATHGNLYLLSADDTQYTRENISLLQGKTLGVMQLANVPGLTLRATLADLLDGEAVSTIQMQGVSAVTEVDVKAAAGGVGTADVYLVPEPAATARLKKLQADGKTFYRVGDLQSLYGGTQGFPQAAVVVKKSFIYQEADKFAKIMDGLMGAETYLATAEIATICGDVASHLEGGLKASLSDKNLTAEVIARSNVRFESSVDCRVRVDEFLQKLSVIDTQKARPVASEFYYLGE